MINSEERVFDAEALLKEARKAMSFAYAPYSSFPVGAAILFEDDSVITGCNVENGSYGLSICAERNAMTAAVREGRLRPLAIAIAGKEGKLCPPCGACRQFLSEFNSDMFVVMEDGGRPVIYKLCELLPMHFELPGKGETKDDR